MRSVIFPTAPLAPATIKYRRDLLILLLPGIDRCLPGIVETILIFYRSQAIFPAILFSKPIQQIKSISRQGSLLLMEYIFHPVTTIYHRKTLLSHPSCLSSFRLSCLMIQLYIQNAQRIWLLHLHKRDCIAISLMPSPAYSMNTLPSSSFHLLVPM